MTADEFFFDNTGAKIYPWLVYISNFIKLGWLEVCLIKSCLGAQNLNLCQISACKKLNQALDNLSGVLDWNICQVWI